MFSSPRHFTLFLLCLLYSQFLSGQNLIPNPGFESYTSCPAGFGTEGDMLCTPWTNANETSCDYYHECSGSIVTDVPANYFGEQTPHTGNAYAGLWIKAFTPSLEYFEYLESPLTTPLQAGKAYHVEMYVSLPGRFCGVDQIGAYFQTGALQATGWQNFSLIPQIESNIGFLNDTTEWMLVQGCFIAEGGEDHIVIGNFHNFANTLLDPACTAVNDTQSYYFIDDVSVTEIALNGLSVDLGNDVTVCELTLSPGHPGASYLWSNGSSGSTLTVTQSGIYSVTVDDGCQTGYDSIEVTITNQPSINLNPNFATICPGQNVTVSLDPMAGTYVWQDGSASSHYIISIEGTYSVTFSDGCDLTSDQIVVDLLLPPAPFTLGPDTILCTGTEIEINMDPGLGNFTWQDLSHGYSNTITTGGFYTLTISNMCGSASDGLFVTGIAPNTINFGADEALLCNGESWDIIPDSAYATFLWQDGSTFANYHITQDGLYTVTMTHTCGTSSDSVQVSTNITPTFTLGDTLNACLDDTLILSVNGITGNYLWQDGSVNDTMIVTTPGMYALSVSNFCGADQDSVLVMYDPVITPIDLGPDVSLCPGSTMILTPSSADAQYLWQDGSTDDTFIVTNAGIYHVTVTSNCYQYMDTIAVSVLNGPPTILLPPTLTLCQGTIEELNPGVAGVTFLWNDGSEDPTLNITAPGEYSLTITSTCGSDTDTIQVVDGGPLPTVALGPNADLCPGQQIALTPTFTDVDTWLWSDGSATSMFTISDSGDVSVIVSNACGNAYDTINIDLLESIPDLDLGVDTGICPGGSMTLSIPFQNVAIAWNDGSSNTDLIITSAGMYFATISNDCGISVDTIQLDLLPTIPALDLGLDVPLCPGEVITLDPGVADVEYLWHDGSIGSTFLIDHAQEIILTISNSCGASMDTLDVITNANGPDVELGPDIRACEGNIVTVETHISGVDFLWQDGSTGPSYATTVSGNFFVQVSNACGIDVDTIGVDIHGSQPDASLGPDTTLCDEEFLVLNSNADAETVITWQDGSSGSHFDVASEGLYTLSVSNFCGADVDSIFVFYQPLPAEVIFGADTILCAGETLMLSAPATTDLLAWQDGSLGSSYVIDEAGTYSLTISNSCGSNSDEIIVAYDDMPIIFPSEDQFAMCPWETLSLTSLQSFSASYLWSTGNTSAGIEITTPGEYAVTIKTVCQEDSHEFYVIPSQDCEPLNQFFVPNIFSPNHDEINDVFSVSTHTELDIVSMQGNIYDRWGNLIYTSTEIPFTWDGRFEGNDLLPGVYVYAVEIGYNFHGVTTREKLRGNITLLR